jgi:hypothetical protein
MLAVLLILDTIINSILLHFEYYTYFLVGNTVFTHNKFSFKKIVAALLCYSRISFTAFKESGQWLHTADISYVKATLNDHSVVLPMLGRRVECADVDRKSITKRT